LSIASGPGSYVLYIVVEQEARVRVGKSGIFDFYPGGYFYSGSAQGPGGVKARLKHHLRPAVNPRWHLDWLRPYARVIQGYAVLSEERLECLWSKALARLPGSGIPAAGFGASDCRNGCPAHLIYFANGAVSEQIQSVLQSFAKQPIRELSSADLAILD
jgi:Uri superfamily endonuclease